ARQAGKGAVELLGALRQWAPLDALQAEGPEHLLEEPHVAELLGQMVAADLVDQVLRSGQGRRLVPGCRDADPLVACELVEKGQEQGPPVEAARIVAHRLVVAVERLTDRAARPDRIRVDAREALTLLPEILRVLEDLAVAALLIGPIALEVLLALARRGGREDRQASWPPGGCLPVGHGQVEYTLRDPGGLFGGGLLGQRLRTRVGDLLVLVRLDAR